MPNAVLPANAPTPAPTAAPPPTPMAAPFCVLFQVPQLEKINAKERSNADNTFTLFILFRFLLVIIQTYLMTRNRPFLPAQ